MEGRNSQTVTRQNNCGESLDSPASEYGSSLPCDKFDKRSLELVTYLNYTFDSFNPLCHLFRHAMATLMLENGADIRYVQEMLGHAWLNTTEIYTHVNIQKLIEVHRLTHPAKVD